ncbi:MAG: 4-alpha-glucanotransferase [Roseiflexus sp.]|nr:4-alpha-glucanotransferase [Roseiflexus sp.]MCS7288336.1 4-alpha-glucanotransferase [Roseiflexus sp.]MDW8148949.1 4-alpha-glucanotransferase [Roseiflexaceae bacterium]MDW8233383.1 4-alpha-glucanotransferase [Roseiflexaceae bacterium]
MAILTLASRTLMATFLQHGGLILHPTSLPSLCSIGDLEDEAYRFVDFLAAAEQTYRQILTAQPNWTR